MKGKHTRKVPAVTLTLGGSRQQRVWFKKEKAMKIVQERGQHSQGPQDSSLLLVSPIVPS
jgi:hypothetical protein